MGLFVSPIRDSGAHTRFLYKPAIKQWRTNYRVLRAVICAGAPAQL